VSTSKPRSFSSVCKIFRVQHPIGAEILSSKRVYFVVNRPKSTITKRGKNCSRSLSFPILDISIIPKIFAVQGACFCPKNFGEGTQFWDLGLNSQNMTFLRQFYDILHTYANVLIHKTSYDNFTTKIFLGVLRHSKLYDSNIIQQWKISLYRFIRPLIQLYS